MDLKIPSDQLTRIEIARELLASCQPDSCLDFAVIAHALEYENRSKEDILTMPELKRWPTMYNWLKEKL
jgi:hypothetical protein